MKHFSRRMRKLRCDRNMSVADVANGIGVSRITVYKYENGEILPNLFTAYCIAELFNVSIDFLVGREVKQ